MSKKNSLFTEQTIQSKLLKNFYKLNKRKIWFFIYIIFALVFSGYLIHLCPQLFNNKELSANFLRHLHGLVYVFIPLLFLGALLLELFLLIDSERTANLSETEKERKGYFVASILCITISMIILMFFDWAKIDPVFTVITSLMIPFAAWISHANKVESDDTTKKLAALETSINELTELKTVINELTELKTAINELNEEISKTQRLLNTTTSTPEMNPILTGAKHHKTPLKYKIQR